MSGAVGARRAQPWLGTLVEVCIAEALIVQQAAAFDAAFDAIAAIHNAMSPQRPESDLARFNVAAVGTWRRCEHSTLAVLRAARALGETSDGAFDITLGTGGLDAWALHDEQLHKLKPGTRLDASGIAKGYAVDGAIATLQAAGVLSGWVNAGGDLRVFGTLDLPIHIRSPDDPARTLPLTSLSDGALATSVLPLPDGGRTHVTVAAPECLWADALTKVVAYSTPAHSAALLARYHARAWRHAAF